MRPLLVWIAFGVVLTATAGPRADQEGDESVAKVDFKVVVWYRKAEPIDTFKYQIYDLRKGEYTPAVDEWLELMRTRHPNFEVIVRDVDLATEKGPSDARKVGSVVYRELLSAAAAQGVFVGAAAPPPLSPAPRYRRPESLASPTPSLGPMPGLGYSPVLPMFYQNPLPMGFPVPMPYPRPHP